MLHLKKELTPSAKLFGWKKEFRFPFHSLIITLFGHSWRILYTRKKDCSFVDSGLRCQLDALTQAFVAQSIELKTRKTLRAFERLNTSGVSTDFYFKGDLDGTAIFVKAVFTGWKKDLGPGDTVLGNEFAKGRMLAACSPHVIEPLYYFNGFPCEILISPLIEEARTLLEVVPKTAEEFDWIAEQVLAIKALLEEKRLVHRDIQESNFVIGRLAGNAPQLFLVDLAFMKSSDGRDDQLPLALDRSFLRIVRRENDDGAFESMLERLRDKLPSRS